MSLMKTAITADGIKVVLYSFRIIERIYVSFSPLTPKPFKMHSNVEACLRIKSIETRDVFSSILSFI